MNAVAGTVGRRCGFRCAATIAAATLAFVLAPAADAPATLAFALAPAADAAPPAKTIAARGPSGFWTAERMASARPVELAQRGGEAGLSLGRRNHTVPYLSGPVADPSVPPLPSNGKLFGKIAGLGRYSCSATVVDTAGDSTILTAGHCAYDPFFGRFASKLLFVPGYDQGTEPLGRFAGRVIETTREWSRDVNSNFDYAAIALRKRDDGATVEAVAGAVPMLANGPRQGNYAAYGYPGNRGTGQLMWRCGSGYAGDDPRPIPRGPKPIGIGCDMKAGASGGGWLNAAGQLVSLTSFGYRKHPELLYGPYLTNKATKLVARIGSQ